MTKVLSTFGDMTDSEFLSSLLEGLNQRQIADYVCLGRAIEAFLKGIDQGLFTHASLGKKRDGSAYMFTMNCVDAPKKYATGSDHALLGEDIAYQVGAALGFLRGEDEEESSDEIPF